MTNKIGLSAYESLPLSEQTLIRHKYNWHGVKLLNDFGYPCDYRIITNTGMEIGRVKYYKQRKLMFYEVLKES